jgi:hypothetical protein
MLKVVLTHTVFLFRNLQTICVASRNDSVWARFAAALAQQQLPSLRELHIKHSSHTDAAHLEQLRGILQVCPQSAILFVWSTEHNIPGCEASLVPWLPHMQKVPSGCSGGL